MATTEFYAFGDESGVQHSQPYCVVAGYVGSLHQWVVLRRGWKATLRKYGVSELHATDLFTRWRDQTTGETKQRGEYKNWSDLQVNAFIDELTEMISALNLHPVGGAIDVPAFNSFTIGERRTMTGGIWDDNHRKFLSRGAPDQPYRCALFYFLREALGHTPANGKLHIVLDKKAEAENGALQAISEAAAYKLLYNWERYADLNFRDSKAEEAIQAADLITHLWYEWHVRGSRMGKARLRAMNVLAKKRSWMAIFDAEAIEENLAARWPPEVRARIKAAQ